MATSNLMNTEAGRGAMKQIVCHLAKRRMSRFFKKSFSVEAYRVLSTPGGVLNTNDILGEFNDQLDPEILGFFDILGQIGCLSESIQDTNIYIDPINGSDVTGRGTLAAPWASFWFIPGLPIKINHHYRIILLNDVSADDLIFNLDFGDNGSLAIIGGYGPIIQHGPFVTTVVGPTDGTSGVTTTRTVGGSMWTDDQFTGDFFQFTTGNHADSDLCAIPVHMNFQEDLITLTNFHTGPEVAGWQFQIIRPAITLQCDSFEINARGPTSSYTDVSTGLNVGTRAFIGNMNLDIYNSNKKSRGLALRGDCHMGLSFLRVIIDSTWPHAIDLSAKTINAYSPVDTLIDAYAHTNIANFLYSTSNGSNSGVSIHDSDGPHFQNMATYCNRPDIIVALDTRDGIVVTEWCSFYQVAAGYFELNGMYADITAMHLDGGPDGDALRQQCGQIKGGHMHFSGVFPTAGNALSCIRFESGHFRMDNATCSATVPLSFTNVGVDHRGTGIVHFESNPAAITGQNGDIDFVIAGIVAHPAANNTSVNDANGNYVYWINI